MNIFGDGSKVLFWGAYNNISPEDKLKHDLPNKLYDQYKNKFDSTTWSDIVGFDVSKYLAYKTFKSYENVEKLKKKLYFYRKILKKQFVWDLGNFSFMISINSKSSIY